LSSICSAPSNSTPVEVPARRGFALRDAIDASQRHNSTRLGNAVEKLNRNEKCDRLIVITDEQAHDRVPAPSGKGYLINVASHKNGVGATASGCTSMVGARQSSNASARWSRPGSTEIVRGGLRLLALREFRQR
jgi:hypothetical protein